MDTQRSMRMTRTVSNAVRRTVAKSRDPQGRRAHRHPRRRGYRDRHFRKHPGEQPVLLVVTDGEPTAHLLGDGQAWFAYPPHPLTITSTVRALENARRLGAQATFFRLGEDPGLARFVDQMAARVDGRVVAPELDDLGAAVVGSYLGARTGMYGGGAHLSDWYGGRGFWTG